MFCWWLESCWGHRSPPTPCLSWQFTGCISCWNFPTCHNNMTSKTSVFIMWYLFFFVLSRVGRASILEIKHSYILLHDLSHHHLSFFSLRYPPGHVLCQTSWNQTAGYTLKLSPLGFGDDWSSVADLYDSLSCSSASGFHGRVTKYEWKIVGHISTSVPPPEWATDFLIFPTTKTVFT